MVILNSQDGSYDEHLRMLANHTVYPIIMQVNQANKIYSLNKT